MIRSITLYLFAMLCVPSVVAQKKHLRQSKPFEQVLKSLKTDDPELFMNSFSERIVDGETDMEVWTERLNEGQDKFGQRFPNFKLSEFRYRFDRKEAKLIVYYRGEEQVRMKVVREGRHWKLDQK